MKREQYIEEIIWYLEQLSDDNVRHVYWLVDRLFLREPK